MDLLDLHGRVAVVTGGGTGIGAATARLLAVHGADVAIAARTVHELQRTAQKIEADSGRRCLVVPTDVKDEGQVAAMIERTVKELGRLDILVNNAGGTRMGPLRDLPTKAWDAGFELNVRSAYIATREAGSHFLEQRSGAIVNVSSDAGVYGVRGGAHYSAAKAALQMFTEVTAAEWGLHGVRANCVAVGGIASERAKAAWEVAGIDPAAIGEGAMLRRIGRPEEVAATILFLVSDARPTSPPRRSQLTGDTRWAASATRSEPAAFCRRPRVCGTDCHQRDQELLVGFQWIAPVVVRPARSRFCCSEGSLLLGCETQ